MAATPGVAAPSWTFIRFRVLNQMPVEDWVNQNGSTIWYDAGPNASSATLPESSGHGWSVYGPPASVVASPWPYQWPAEAIAKCMPVEDGVAPWTVLSTL